jgi:AraC-like DNA-binding protein
MRVDQIECTAGKTDVPDDRTARFDIVHSDALRLYPELVHELGGDPEALLADAHIDAAAAQKGISVLKYRDFVHLLEVTAERLAVPDFGLQLAERQRGGKVIGPVGVVMKNSKTVGQALGYCAKHIHAYSLATRVRYKPDRAKHILFLGLEILLDNVADTRQVIEHALSLANLNVIEITQGAARARRVHFRHRPQMPIKDYRAYFGCDVLFGQEMDGIVLTETDLLCEIVDPDEQVYEMATSFIEARYPEKVPPIHARVRGLILRYLGSEDCTNDRVASEMCMHPRTLQRRLRAEGKSFEEIKDGIRREVALRYLQQPEMSLTRVAEKLGYAETSVLSRSCHRWFEASPLQLRRRSAHEALAAGK